MTLADLASFVTGRLNQTDSDSVAQCKLFGNHRYSVIYDYRNWRDSLKNVEATLTDTVTGILAVPATLDRVLAILAGTQSDLSDGYILYPTDTPLQMQTRPRSFAGQQSVATFEEFTDETTSPPTRNIRFLPVPADTTYLLIAGKRPFVPLADTDEPILRNITECWIAYVTADMLEHDRQYGKAQAKIQEGASLLGSMVQDDTNQSGWAPRVIPDVEDYSLNNSFGMGGSKSSPFG